MNKRILLFSIFSTFLLLPNFTSAYSRIFDNAVVTQRTVQNNNNGTTWYVSYAISEYYGGNGIASIVVRAPNSYNNVFSYPDLVRVINDFDAAFKEYRRLAFLVNDNRSSNGTHFDIYPNDVIMYSIKN